jgi:hypothetical protein
VRQAKAFTEELGARCEQHPSHQATEVRIEIRKCGGLERVAIYRLESQVFIRPPDETRGMEKADAGENLQPGVDVNRKHVRRLRPHLHRQTVSSRGVEPSAFAVPRATLAALHNAAKASFRSSL